MTTAQGKSVLAALVALGALLLMATTAVASGPTTGSPMVAPGEEGQVVLSIPFTPVDGQAASGQRVRFFLETDFMQADVANTRVLLGTATTDADGIAQLSYTPTWEGAQHVVAQWANGGETIVDFEVTGARATYHAEPPALAPLREWAPFVAAPVVVLVWGVIGFVLAWTAYGIWAAGRSATRRLPGYTLLPGTMAAERRQR